MLNFGSGSSSKSSSSTKFPKKFLDQFKSYFGEGEGFTAPGPAYAPKFAGFDNYGAVEEAAYGSEKDKLTRAYDDAISRQREELNQAGLLNSSSQYATGTPRDVLNRNYLLGIEEAARSARKARLETEVGQQTRQTAFNVGEASQQQAIFFKILEAAINAGKRSSSSSSGGFNIGLGGGGAGGAAIEQIFK